MTLDQTLAGVARRIKRNRILDTNPRVLTIAACVVLVLAVVHQAIVPVAVWVYVLAACSALLFGYLPALLQKTTPHDAAKQIDNKLRLKDRVVTALQFQSDDDEMRQRQVAETMGHISTLDPADCVPRNESPVRWLGLGAVLTLLMSVVIFGGRDATASTEALPVALAADQSDLLRETLVKDLEDLREEQTEAPELEELSERMEELVEQLEEDSIDEMDMMATLSEMETALTEARNALNMAETDAELQQIAEAMMNAESLQGAASAMKEQEYEKASKDLMKADPSKIGDKSRRAVSGGLKKWASNMEPGKFGSLLTSVTQLSEGLDKKDSSQCKSGLCELAKACDKQSNCKKIGKCLSKQLARLSQCKSQCRGQCKKPRSSSSKVSASNEDSLSVGSGTIGELMTGAPKRTDVKTEQWDLEGEASEDGPSESETLQSAEGQQSASRAYQQRYRDFRRQAEAVMENEQLPLGHQETVRQYFEAIRPVGAEGEAIENSAQ
ncbi:MAG: hypothetical protein AAF664_15655 [Planctomycetota bacterium]